MSSWFEQFHFIRPVWLLAIPVIIFIVRWRIGIVRSAGWSGHIAKDKLTHLAIDATETDRKRHWLVLPPMLLACIAMAGPSWQLLPGDVASNRQAMVILFDLSPSMAAQDIKPSRLQRASLKLIDLLRTRVDGETALIAYAGDAHRVSPLTDDPAIIESLVDVLHPEIMPVSGSEPELAIDLAMSLFSGAELSQGDIVLITDGVHPDAVATIKQSIGRGFRLSVLGVGSTEGAPIPAGKVGFLRDAREQLIIASLDEALLRELALHFGGRYIRITPDSADVEYLSALSALPFSAEIKRDQQSFDTAHDGGYWLILLLLPLAAYVFRRHMIWALFPLLVFPPESRAWSWNDLWYSGDQQGTTALQNGENELAAELFESRQWSAVARYRNGEFTQAAELFAKGSHADDFYNAANAHALAGNLEDALAHYDQALNLNPSHQDALYNREFLLAIVRQKNEEEDGDNEQNRRGAGVGESDEESPDSQQQDMAGSSGDQQQIGGTAGAGQSLAQQAARDGGQSTSTSAQTEPSSDDSGEASPVQKPGAISSRDSDDGTTADSGALKIEDSESTVLNPYSEQWLRMLPKDPGGYLRRKFQYQTNMRLQENAGVEPVLEEGRY